MSDSPRQIEWTADDRVSLRTLFGSITGRKFLTLIAAQIPRVEGETMEKVTIASLKKQGADDIVNFIRMLAADVLPDMQEGIDFVNMSKEGD